MRDKHYDLMSFRLSKENKEWLKSKKENNKSWNLTFNKIRENDEYRKTKEEGKANVYNLLKCVKGCKYCTDCVEDKGCKNLPETVQKMSINGANSAPQLDKELDKKKIRNLLKFKHERERMQQIKNDLLSKGVLS